MKKTYIAPKDKVITLNMDDMLMQGSGNGVATGCSVGDEYNNQDVSYAKQYKSLWDEEW